MKETLFILGREPEFSVAELEARAPSWAGTIVTLSKTGALVRHEQELHERILNRLGGSIKQVEVIEHWPKEISVNKTLHEQLTQSWLLQNFPESGRVEFGISAYDMLPADRALVQKIALRLKKEITAADRAVRYVTSQDHQLSAVTVQRNGLVKKGKEFVLFQNDGEILVGITKAVQDYQLYGLRDFGRPAANAKSGMIPPKLAQMMLNIAQVTDDDLLLDPFCGSGTIVQEATLMGVKKIIASDLESRAVKETQENIKWLFTEFADLQSDVEITLRDARQVTTKADVIVTEPYLGKPLRGHEPQDWLAAQAREIGTMYLQCFTHWRKYLKSGARIVMVWPEFSVGEVEVSINIEPAILALGFQQQQILSNDAATKLHISTPTVLTYARDDARVKRQVRMWKVE